MNSIRSVDRYTNSKCMFQFRMVEVFIRTRVLLKLIKYKNTGNRLFCIKLYGLAGFGSTGLGKFLVFNLKRHAIKHLKKKKRTCVYMFVEWAKIDQNQ